MLEFFAYIRKCTSVGSAVHFECSIFISHFSELHTGVTLHNTCSSQFIGQKERLLNMPHIV